MPIQLPPDPPNSPIGGPSQPDQNSRFAKAIQSLEKNFMGASDNPLEVSEGILPDPMTTEETVTKKILYQGDTAATLLANPLSTLGDADPTSPPPR